MNSLFFTNEYFYLRQRIPLLIYAVYVHFVNKNNPGINKIIDNSLLLINIVTSYAIIGYITQIPFQKLFLLDWRYEAIITWGIFLLVYYYMSLKIVNNKLHSFTLASLAAVGGGWLYEIPFFNPLNMFFHHYAIFYLDTQFICLLLLVYEFKKLNFKPNRTFYFALALYMIFSIILYRDPLFFESTLWLYRVPACLLLISPLRCIQMEVKT